MPSKAAAIKTLDSAQVRHSPRHVWNCSCMCCHCCRHVHCKVCAGHGGNSPAFKGIAAANNSMML